MAEQLDLPKIAGSRFIDNSEVLESYSTDESFVNSVRPRYVIKPENGEQVKEIIRWANKTLTPLVPVSSGAPHFRGDTVPAIGGAVIVDLSGMKKIIRISEKRRVAIVEPGVTFAELVPQLDEQGLRLNMPLIPRISKSVMGSMLEREPVIMPKYHWNLADPLLSTELVWGSGDVFRTGAVARPGTLEEQWELGCEQDDGSGPGQADYYRIIQGAQGTMGIVTWAALRCERMPTLDEAFMVGSSTLDNISELAHWLIRLRLANECLVLNNVNLASILAREWPGEYKMLKDALPSWVLFLCVSGYKYLPEERVNYQINDMKDIAKREGVEPVKAINGISASEILRILRSPSGEPYWKLRSKGSCHDIFFLTTRDKISEFIKATYDKAVQYNYPVPDIGIYLQPIVQGTSYHCEFNLFINPQDKTEADKVRKLSAATVEALKARGAFFSRPYGPWSDMAYRGDSETTAVLRKVKKIFDPNDIMNPGKLCF